MKRIIFILTVLFLNGCTSAKNINLHENNQSIKFSFQDVWDQVTSDQLTTLPENKVSFLKLFSLEKDIIIEDSKRTLNNHADIIS